jgi:hypothetical protein
VVLCQVFLLARVKLGGDLGCIAFIVVRLLSIASVVVVGGSCAARPPVADLEMIRFDVVDEVFV